MSSLADNVRKAGVIGAGGAGFPTYVKLSSQTTWFLVNGAECEPLMHKDRELMVKHAKEVVSGLKLASQAVGAEKLGIGIKSKNRVAIDAIKTAIGQDSIMITEFGDYYPAGDEYELVYSITGKLIPPQGIPLDIGAVVNNVETLYNVHQAANGIPVTETFMTITGAVSHPISAWFPVGMKVRDVLQCAGGPTLDDFGVMESGLMMGTRVTDLDQPVKKTSGGLIVLPADHDLIRRYDTPPSAQDRIGHSACDQCSYCTELCPRYLLGYDVQPHLVMRSLGFTAMGSELWNKYSVLCCQCGLCTLYACPEALFPREACVKGMNDLREIGEGKWQGNRELKPHPMHESRRVPIKRLMNRLGVSQYEAHAEWTDVNASPDEVIIPLNQHIGTPAEPVVTVDSMVKRGDMIADVSTDKLGVPVHASIDGRVKAIHDQRITIERV